MTRSNRGPWRSEILNIPRIRPTGMHMGTEFPVFPRSGRHLHAPDITKNVMAPATAACRPAFSTHLYKQCAVGTNVTFLVPFSHLLLLGLQSCQRTRTANPVLKRTSSATTRRATMVSTHSSSMLKPPMLRLTVMPRFIVQ